MTSDIHHIVQEKLNVFVSHKIRKKNCGMWNKLVLKVFKIRKLTNYKPMEWELMVNFKCCNKLNEHPISRKVYIDKMKS